MDSGYHNSPEVYSRTIMSVSVNLSALVTCIANGGMPSSLQQENYHRYRSIFIPKNHSHHITSIIRLRGKTLFMNIIYLVCFPHDNDMLVVGEA